MASLPRVSFECEASAPFLARDGAPPLGRPFDGPAAVPAVDVQRVAHAYNKKVCPCCECRCASNEPVLPVQVPVLQETSLCIPQGSIYALLGPSGCGKTTMLKCVLGQLTPQAGSVAVFGMPPGASNDCVPGPGVGYMPQDTALDLELTVSELLYTYGTLSGLDSTEIAARSAALITLLELGAVDAVLPALCKNLSGGQARRVSLCCAMLHTPRLLLLDEPTVGVDPVLREKIWRTLVDLACGGTTVLITTHYIDEARQAGAVGFMRHGKIIAEGSPARLLEQYRVASLEDVFLRLCRPAAAADTADYASSVVLAHKPPPVGQVQAPTPPGAAAVLSVNRPPSLLRRSLGALSAWTATGVVGGGTRATAVNRRLPRWRMMAASAYRSLKRLQHNPGFVVFAFLLPALQVCLFCMAIGGDPYGLNFGVVNADVGGAMLGQPVNLGAELVAGLPASTFTLKTFDTVASARAAVLAGDAWGYLYVPGNYTTDLGLRFFDHPTVRI
jgi:ABC-type multidrug transport system ATPase subunit